MATLLDTSAVVVAIRRHPPRDLRELAHVAGEELASGHAVLSSVTVAELLTGARGPRGLEELEKLLELVPVVATDRDVALHAGRLGAAGRRSGVTVPVADLLIAATALHLDIPVLTCDSDFGRVRSIVGEEIGEGRQASAATRRPLRVHPASVLA